MIYLSKGGAGADSDHTWIRPCLLDVVPVKNGSASAVAVVYLNIGTMT